MQRCGQDLIHTLEDHGGEANPAKATIACLHTDLVGISFDRLKERFVFKASALTRFVVSVLSTLEDGSAASILKRRERRALRRSETRPANLLHYIGGYLGIMGVILFHSLLDRLS